MQINITHCADNGQSSNAHEGNESEYENEKDFEGKATGSVGTTRMKVHRNR